MKLHFADCGACGGFGCILGARAPNLSKVVFVCACANVVLWGAANNTWLETLFHHLPNVICLN